MHCQGNNSNQCSKAVALCTQAEQYSVGYVNSYRSLSNKMSTGMCQSKQVINKQAKAAALLTFGALVLEIS